MKSRLTNQQYLLPRLLLAVASSLSFIFSPVVSQAAQELSILKQENPQADQELQASLQIPEDLISTTVQKRTDGEGSFSQTAFDAKSWLAQNTETPVTEEKTPDAVTETPVTEEKTPDAATRSNNQVIDATKIQILTPTPNTIVQNPSTSIVVQFPQGANIQLRISAPQSGSLRDRLVDSSLIGRVETDAANGVIIQTWYGVGLSEGENEIIAEGSLNGTPLESVTTKIIVAGQPKSLRIQTLESRIPADGRSTATVQGQLLDKNNNVSNWETMVTLYSSAGKFIGTDAAPSQPGFQVKTIKGEFSATLQAGAEAETVRIAAKTSEFESFTEMQFTTQLRQDSLLTGFIDLRLGARGTNYYSNFRDFLPLDQDNGTELDFTSAVFATGSLGEWKYTAAFNSDRGINKDCDCDNRLFGTYQSSELQYPTYGDSSSNEKTTPSIDQVYASIERSQPGINNADYFMWGDFRTEEFATSAQEFSSTSRELHGFKGNYNFGNLQLTGFYAVNVQGFQRDTIAPDGTSGYYFLSRRLLLPGSEEVYLEWEELNRPGTVVRRERQSRVVDYDIDYDRGTLLFRKPILRTDVDDRGEILVARIVTTYQYDSPNDSDTNIIAGRIRYNFSQSTDQPSYIGTSYLREDKGDHDFELYGADTEIALGTTGKLIAEYAHSTNQMDFVGAVSGSAYRAEIEGNITEDITGRAFYRTADPGFSNNATVSFVPGQTRYGADLQARVGEDTSLRFTYDHEDNFGTAPRPLTDLQEFLNPTTDPIPGSKLDNSLTTISAGILQNFGDASLSVDWVYRNREDRVAPNELTSSSHQLSTRLNVPITDKISFNALNETSLSSQNDPIYPDRTAIGLDWEILDGVTLNLAQQWFTSGRYAGDSITNIGINGEYNLGRDTTITGRYAIATGMNDTIGQGAIGLKQKWEIASGLRMDFAYEHVFSTFRKTAAGSQYVQPFAVGRGASSLGLSDGDSYSVGIEYTDNPDWKASAKFEHRTSSGGSNTVLTANLTGKLSPALTGIIEYDQSSSANQVFTGLGTTRKLNVGLAYRDPNDDRFNALLRYQFRQNPSTIPNTILLGSGTGSEEHVFSAEAIYAPNWRWEFYGKYAFRSSTTYLADDFAGHSSVNLAQLRVSYRLGYNFDLVGETRWIYQPSAGYTETGFVIEAGYYLTPELRLAAGYVFGNVDDRDFSGSRSAGGPYIGVTMKLNGLFDGFGEQRVTPPQQQELKNQPQLNTSESTTLPPQEENTPSESSSTNNNQEENNNSEATPKSCPVKVDDAEDSAASESTDTDDNCEVQADSQTANPVPDSDTILDNDSQEK